MFYRDAAVALLLALVVICVMVVLLSSVGPVESTTGRVTGFTIAGSRGIQPVMIVEVPGRTVHFRGSEGGGCAVGDEVALTRQRGLFGWRYRAARVPDGCRTPAARPDVATEM